MDDIYLEDKSKQYYSTDFLENVLSETDEFWKLDDLIRSHLVDINGCKHIQPLYSKISDFTKFGSRESYLWIAYTKKVELKLLREILPLFIIKYNEPSTSKFIYTFNGSNEPRSFRPGNPNIKMGCFSNPDYFKINQLHLSLTVFNKDRHLQFWEDIRIQLMNTNS